MTKFDQSKISTDKTEWSRPVVEVVAKLDNVASAPGFDDDEDFGTVPVPS